MSKADEMFEELGYSKNNNFEYCKMERNIETYIWFNIRSETVECFYKYANDEDNDVYSMEVPMLELQAINCKCEELGWIKERD